MLSIARKVWAMNKLGWGGRLQTHHRYSPILKVRKLQNSLYEMVQYIPLSPTDIMTRNIKCS